MNAGASTTQIFVSNLGVGEWIDDWWLSIVCEYAKQSTPRDEQSDLFFVQLRRKKQKKGAEGAKKNKNFAFFASPRWKQEKHKFIFENLICQKLEVPYKIS